ncbi:uncharacterized protein TNCV_1886271 [Trichonephila clavipes]|nr:uncharacterized protein TNCV_1886271 [Trichonephila clavipes]
MSLTKVIFMQDSVPPHIMTEVKQFLKKTFTDERILTHHFTHEWPPRSADLKPIYFWLWGYIKSGVNRNSPSLVELKDAICYEFSCIQLEKLHAVVSVVITHLQTVICGDWGLSE